MAKAHTIQMTKSGEQVTFSKEPASVIAMLANGSYTVTIARKRTARSFDQNSLMWLWFTCIEDQTGTSRLDVHDYYCLKYLVRHAVINGRMEYVVGGTSKLSKGEMTAFLEKVRADAAQEFGISLPLPEDRNFEMFLNEYR